MRVIKLNLKERAYRIVFGENLLDASGRLIGRLNIGKDAFVITNPLIKKRFACRLNKSLQGAGFTVRYSLIPDTEKSKSIKTALSLIKDLSSYDKRRQVFIVGLGGGVVGDVAGFVSSIYKRGIPYVQIPTTLLGQIDSAIGGKTAVDLKEGKNLLGAFYQPRLVISDLSVLDSLSSRQLKAGLSEAIKYAVIKDRELFAFLEKGYKDILNLNRKSIQFLVCRCSKIKARIIEEDEKENKGIRTILNFGHTLGHAIEAAYGYQRYNHGEAVGLGMLAAAYISKKTNLIKDNIYQRIKRLIGAVGLPTAIEKVPLAKIINAHFRDKKFIGARNRFVLIKGIGKAAVVNGVKLKIIRESLGSLQRSAR